MNINKPIDVLQYWSQTFQKYFSCTKFYWYVYIVLFPSCFYFFNPYVFLFSYSFPVKDSKWFCSYWIPLITALIILFADQLIKENLAFPETDWQPILINIKMHNKAWSGFFLSTVIGFMFLMDKDKDDVGTLDDHFNNINTKTAITNSCKHTNMLYPCFSYNTLIQGFNK